MPGPKDYGDLYRALTPEGKPKAHPVPMGPHPAVIAEVDPLSPAASAGLKPRDAIVRANDVVLRDVIDWRWYADGEAVALVVRDPLGHERELAMGRSPGESWGIEFEHLVFDGVKTCRNDCTFCFVKQLPKGMRRPLYVRDDDYRLSFLTGNFITLTNLSDAEMDRITEQHISPLYVSLHSVDPIIRRELVCAHEDRAMERLDQLVEAGIEMHVQIVLIPGDNDASRLDQTLTWLAMHDGILSVGVVPIGYTDHQSRFNRSYENWRDAAAVIDQLDPWRQAFRQRDGISWVHAADEFFLNARRPVPPAFTYDGYPQFENGIGMVRAFRDEFAERADELKQAAEAWRSANRDVLKDAPKITVVTGTLFAPALETLLAGIGVDDVVRVLAAPNHFFGGNVSVTGLLTEHDLSSAMRGDDTPGAYLLPDIVGNDDGLTLDDVPISDIGPLTGHDVRLVSSDAAGLVSGVTNAVEHPPAPRPKSR